MRKREELSSTANKDIQESVNKDDEQKKNMKIIKHIAAIMCVIKSMADSFLDNPSPVIYLMDLSIILQLYIILQQVVVCHAHGC